MKRTGELQRKAPMKAKRKRKTSTQERWRSPEYLAWVRSLPCSLCGMEPSDAHHLIGMYGLSGMGLTAPDSFAMPLCRLHHQATHESPEMQQAQPIWLRFALNRGIRQLTGETREALQRALRFIDEKEAA